MKDENKQVEGMHGSRDEEKLSEVDAKPPNKIPQTFIDNNEEVPEVEDFNKYLDQTIHPREPPKVDQTKPKWFRSWFDKVFGS